MLDKNVSTEETALALVGKRRLSRSANYEHKRIADVSHTRLWNETSSGFTHECRRSKSGADSSWTTL
eukprot:4077136-Amphidinium_carterae.1